MNNPLLEPFDQAPFSKIREEHFEPAFRKAIADAKTEIDEIAGDPRNPSFENTLETLDFAGRQLDRVSSVFFNLNAAQTNVEIQKIAQEVSPLLSEFKNDISLNQALFQRVKRVYDQREILGLDPEQDMLLDKTYKSFSRNGALLGDRDKKRLREIDSELSKLSLKFGENVLAETNGYELALDREEDLEGLPEGEREAAAELARSKGREGWLVSLEYPSYIPFMKYARNRELRRELYLAFGSRCFHGDHLDNTENILKIVNLRHERAQLLGYPSHAHFVLEERMAKSPEKVLGFLGQILEKAKPAAQRELAELEAFAKELDSIDRLEKWDTAYYSEKLRQKRFDLDDERLKPYFKLENVIKGVFTVADKLFGLQFREVDGLEKYHPDVKTFEVYDRAGIFVALFYGDFHPRAGKRPGAWMTSFKPQYKLRGVNHRPHISNVCNFTKPTSTKPSLLTFNEVTTLFHEFGHALHGILADTTYPSLSGTSVYWDFVELPSQLMENWCYEKEALELFAFHYQTGEPIPMDLVERIRESATFQQGMATLRQLGFGFLDLAWHSGDPKGFEQMKALEDRAFEATELFPQTPQTCMSTSFSHIFQGGYSSGYYSYKWAEVLDADAFSYFKEHGIFNMEVADRFRENILSKGGSEDPMELYKRFRGSEPGIDALLKRAGLIEQAP